VSCESMCPIAVTCMFSVDNQFYPSLGPDDVDTNASRVLARTAAERSMVLLRNDGPTPVLPVSATAKLAFIGPHANATEAMLSNYHGDNSLVYSHSPLMVRTPLAFTVD
jgi:beta-glucosidase-like glycosyl hydrolase